MKAILKLIPELTSAHEVIYHSVLAVDVDERMKTITVDNRFTLKFTATGRILCKQVATYDLKNRKLKPYTSPRTRFLAKTNFAAVTLLLKALYAAPIELEISKSQNCLDEDGDGLTKEIHIDVQPDKRSLKRKKIEEIQGHINFCNETIHFFKTHCGGQDGDSTLQPWVNKIAEYRKELKAVLSNPEPANNVTREKKSPVFYTTEEHVRFVRG